MNNMDLEKQIFEKVQDYLLNFRSYPTDVVLGITKTGANVLIDSPSKMDASVDVYPISDVILEGVGCYLPDAKAAKEIAEKYK